MSSDWKLRSSACLSISSKHIRPTCALNVCINIGYFFWSPSHSGSSIFGRRAIEWIVTTTALRFLSILWIHASGQYPGNRARHIGASRVKKKRDNCQGPFFLSFVLNRRVPFTLPNFCEPTVFESTTNFLLLIGYLCGWEKEIGLGGVLSTHKFNYQNSKTSTLGDFNYLDFLPWELIHETNTFWGLMQIVEWKKRNNRPK